MICVWEPEYQNANVLYSVIMSYQDMQHCHQVVGATTTKQVFQNLLMFTITRCGCVFADVGGTICAEVQSRYVLRQNVPRL